MFSVIVLSSLWLTWKAENQITLHLLSAVEETHSPEWFFDFGEGPDPENVHSFNLFPDWGFYTMAIKRGSGPLMNLRLDPDQKSFATFQIEHIFLRRGPLGPPLIINLEDAFNTNQLAAVQPTEKGGLLLESIADADDPYLYFPVPGEVPSGFLQNGPVYLALSLLVAGLLILILTPPAGRSWQYWGVITIVAGALIFRNYYKFLYPAFYAEDSSIFFAQIYHLGWGSFTETYAGYFHTLIRAGAFIGHQFPIVLTPTVYLVLAVGAHLLVIRLLYSRSLGLERPWVWALGTMAASQSFMEIYANLTNIQWLTAILLVVLAITPLRKGRAYWALEVPILVAVGLTGPFIFFLLPVFLFKFFLQWEKKAVGQAIILCLITSLQAIPLVQFTLSGQMGMGNQWTDFSLWDIFSSAVVYWGYYALGGLLLLNQPFLAALEPFEVLLGTMLIAGAGWGLSLFLLSPKVTWDSKRTVLLLAAVVVCLLSPTFLRVDELPPNRYLFLPNLALLGIVATVLAKSPKIVFAYLILLIALQVAFTPHSEFLRESYRHSNATLFQTAPVIESGYEAPVPSIFFGLMEFFPKGVTSENFFTQSLFRHRFILKPE